MGGFRKWEGYKTIFSGLKTGDGARELDSEFEFSIGVRILIGCEVSFADGSSLVRDCLTVRPEEVPIVQ